MQKLNCWQFKNCGREKDGLLADAFSECPVSVSMKFDGLNGGCGAGRVCWMVRKPDSCSCGNHACHTCEFYRRVLFEQDGKATGQYYSVASS